MLTIDRFCKSFNSEEKVLNNVSFKVKKGEFVVVLGPSGSGKTTLLRCINGLEDSDEGALFFKGLEINKDNNLVQFRKDCGMIFQHYNLVGNLSVINNVLCGALASSSKLASLFYLFSKQKRLRALECLKRVQLLEKAYELTDDLSGGQKQRVGIARAIMQQPLVLLADEPIANLDPMISYDIMSLLKDICVSDEIAVICNLHQVDFALQFADRIVCLVNGSIILDELSSELSSELIYEAYKKNNKQITINNGQIG